MYRFIHMKPVRSSADPVARTCRRVCFTSAWRYLWHLLRRRRSLHQLPNGSGGTRGAIGVVRRARAQPRPSFLGDMPSCISLLPAHDNIYGVSFDRVGRPEALGRAWWVSRRTQTTPIEDS